MGRQHQAVPEAFTTIHAAYAAALKRPPLDGDTRRAYDSRVRTFLAWLEASGLGGDPLTDAHDRDFAIRDYKTHMKTVLRRASNTVNAHLTALDHFFTQLGLGPAVVRRDDAPKLAPRALDARQQKRYLRAVERRPLARDRAIGRLLFYSGVRIAELVALDDDDVPLSARKGMPLTPSRRSESAVAPGLDSFPPSTLSEPRTWVESRNTSPLATKPGVACSPLPISISGAFSARPPGLTRFARAKESEPATWAPRKKDFPLGREALIDEQPALDGEPFRVQGDAVGVGQPGSAEHASASHPGILHAQLAVRVEAVTTRQPAVNDDPLGGETEAA
ncbi:hypothetical protein [Nonomuraea sp. NPDC048916]|uniref:hypothetical protein n=1 Tax=Nonomuraea sp. NPDC048916 TaxID=3154232 RepID=UPI0033CAB41F